MEQQTIFGPFPNHSSSKTLFLNRIKHWRKYGGAPPEGVSGQAVGQAAAILRKANERRRGGFGGGRGGFGGGGGCVLLLH